MKEARKYIGNGDYNLARNNCEHFAVARRYNYHASGQVQGWAAALSVVGVALWGILIGVGKGGSSGSDEDNTETSV